MEPRRTAARAAMFLEDAVGVSVRPLALHEPAPVLAVGAPRRFGCLWRRSRCGMTLEDAEAPVLVAARAPRRIHRCLTLLRAAPDETSRVPEFLRRIAERAVVITLESTVWVSASGVTPETACVFSAAVRGASEARRAAAAVAASAARRLGVAAADIDDGSMLDALRRVSLRSSASIDLVCVCDATAAGFGLLLRQCIDVLGASVLVVPVTSPATLLPPPMILPLP